MKNPRAGHAAAIAYADAIAKRLDATLMAALATFVEPRAGDRDRAIGLIGPLVDTLAGFAIGAAIAPVIACVRRHTGTIDQAAVRRAIGAATRAYDATERKHGSVPSIVVAVIPDPERRPLVDDLGARLRRRLLDGAIEIRAAILAVVAAVPADRIEAVVADLFRLDDDLGLLRFGDQLGHGWQTYVAELAGRPLPAIEPVRSRDLWRHWQRRVRGERPAAPATALTPGEYIVRVA